MRVKVQVGAESRRRSHSEPEQLQATVELKCGMAAFDGSPRLKRCMAERRRLEHLEHSQYEGCHALAVPQPLELNWLSSDQLCLTRSTESTSRRYYSDPYGKGLESRFDTAQEAGRRMKRCDAARRDIGDRREPASGGFDMPCSQVKGMTHGRRRLTTSHSMIESSSRLAGPLAPTQSQQTHRAISCTRAVHVDSRTVRSPVTASSVREDEEGCPFARASAVCEKLLLRLSLECLDEC